MLNTIQIRGKTIKLPIFFPDATRAVVRSLDATDVAATGIEGVLVNTLHLMLEPGDELIRKLGGVGKFMHWDGITVSDSGGFQVYSMIQKRQVQGRVTDDSLVFWATTQGARRKFVLTPERSLEVQFNLGTDIMVVLDDFSPPLASKNKLEMSVDRTIEWAKRSKTAYEKELKKRKISVGNKPLLIGVIQGGEDKKLRARCAKALLDIGFDGYGYGGWPIDKDGKINHEMYRYIGNLIPDDKIKFGLGLGRPQDIVEGFSYGFNMFDCVLPTRDARHGRLYVFNQPPDVILAKARILLDSRLRRNDKKLIEKLNKLFGFLYIQKSIFSKDKNPISPYCDCLTCKHYSRAYLTHLFKVGDTLAYRLSTIHNLRTYAKVIEILRSF